MGASHGLLNRDAGLVACTWLQILTRAVLVLLVGAARWEAAVDCGRAAGDRAPRHPRSQSKPDFTRSISVICHFMCFVSAY